MPQSPPIARKPDPRTMITEESFSIDPRLLGLPLARPWRRACAMSMDGFLVFLLANTPGFLLALAAGIILFRASAPSRSTGYVRRSVRWMLRLSAAVIIFAMVAAGWGRVAGGARSTMAEMGLSGAHPPAAAPAPRGWTSPAPAHTAGANPVSGMDAATDSLALAYAAAVRDGDAVGAERLREEMVAVGADAEAVTLRGELQQRDARIQRLEEDLSAARNPGIVAMIRRFADDLGLGLGWAGLYFTATVALWNGWTPGKRLMSIRIIRLDGKPMGWWMAFERFGGYAASLVTGLLGFAQILWDRNRQAMHDKISETVVIRV